MKKCILFMLLLTMMLSLAVAGTVGAAAESVGDAGACYATTEPTIDGEIDEIWSTTVPMYFDTANYGYVKLLWREDAVYILADLNDCTQVDFLVATRFYGSLDAGTWSWSGNYGLICTPTTDSSSADYVASAPSFIQKTWNGSSFSGGNKTATGATAKAKSNNRNGFVVEVKIPFRDLASEAKVVDKKVGFGAYVNNDYREANCVGINAGDRNADLGLTKSAYALYDMILHSTPDFTQTVAPTCTATGTELGTCHNCKAELMTRTVAALGHDFDMDKTYIDKGPTCTEKGSMSHHCKREGCDGKGSVTEIDALGHTQGEWKMQIAPTCSQKGKEYCVCTRCLKTAGTREIEMLEHTATEWIIDEEPAPGVIGKRHQECTVCGAIFNEQLIEIVQSEGCGASITASAFGVYATVSLAVGAVWKRKKKKD